MADRFRLTSNQYHIRLGQGYEWREKDLPIWCRARAQAKRTNEKITGPHTKRHRRGTNAAERTKENWSTQKGTWSQDTRFTETNLASWPSEYQSPCTFSSENGVANFFIFVLIEFQQGDTPATPNSTRKQDKKINKKKVPSQIRPSRVDFVVNVSSTWPAHNSHGLSECLKASFPNHSVQFYRPSKVLASNSTTFVARASQHVHRKWNCRQASAKRRWRLLNRPWSSSKSIQRHRQPRKSAMHSTSYGPIWCCSASYERLWRRAHASWKAWSYSTKRLVRAKRYRFQPF